MTQARKTALLPRGSKAERSAKRYDALAVVQAEPPCPIQAGVARICDYPPCAKSYIPRRANHAYHSAKCRNAHWFYKKFISLEPAKAPKPGDRVYIQGEVLQRASGGLVEVSIPDRRSLPRVARSVDLWIWERSLLRAKTK